MSANMSSRLAGLVIFTTLLFAFLGWLLPDFLRNAQLPILGLLLVSIGLPHGATDFLLFKRITSAKLTRKHILKFFIIYISAVVGFMLLWLILPLFSFLLFILISAYHFGQSNWENIVLAKKYDVLINLFWGAFAIGGPILWHWEESSVVIGQITGYVINFSKEVMALSQLVLIALNLAIILILKYNLKISYSQLKIEVIKIGVLSLLFYFTPMLVGFSLYFALWHSLSSLNSQILFYKKLWPNFNVIHYYRQAAPFTFLALVGLVMMIYGHPYVLPNVSIISTFVVFIACITLPHVFLIDESYQY
jgi:Brp/Blh family beta-carotene 15,15'-monooxygenase